MTTEYKNWSTKELDAVHKLSDYDYEKISEHVDAINNILSTYSYVRDTEYKDTTQVSNLDVLKQRMQVIKELLPTVSHGNRG